MRAAAVRSRLETQQIAIYLVAIGLGGAWGWVWPTAGGLLGSAVTPVLAALIYTIFLRVPLVSLGKAATDKRFLGALLAANFMAVPLLVWGLFQWAPSNAAVRLGILLVLLTPCVDYVVVFTHLGRGDSRRMLAATPVLLVFQFLLLPPYLWLFLGANTAELLRPGPFVEAFLWFIATPLVLAWLTELWAKRHASGNRVITAMGWGPVPLMGLTLFLVFGAAVPRILGEFDTVLGAVPIYVAYVVLAPLVGLFVARLFALDAGAGRALVFSAGTRNSLVVLPLAFAAPLGGGLVAAVVVTQTLVELVAELAYVRVVPALVSGKK